MEVDYLDGMPSKQRWLHTSYFYRVEYYISLGRYLQSLTSNTPVEKPYPSPHPPDKALLSALQPEDFMAGCFFVCSGSLEQTPVPTRAVADIHH